MPPLKVKMSYLLTIVRARSNANTQLFYIPAVFLRNCAVHLAFPISIIFNRSLKEGVFPMIWKNQLLFLSLNPGIKNYLRITGSVHLIYSTETFWEDCLWCCFNHDKKIRVVFSSTGSNLVGYINYLLKALNQRVQL